MKPTPHKADVDVLVLGAGPAGLSAGLWAVRLGLTTQVVEARDRAGGQAERIRLPLWDFLGGPAEHGTAFVNRMRAQVAEAGVPLRLDTPIVGVDAAVRTLVSAGGERITGRTLVIATGTRPRLPEVLAGIPETLRSFSITPVFGRVTARTIAIVGGGDGAVENAIMAAERCKTVHLLHRRDAFRARPHLLARLRDATNVRIHRGVTVSAAVPDDHDGVALKLSDDTTHRVDFVIVKTGYVPATGMLGGTPVRDVHGRLIVDRAQRTSVAGVFAAGDVCEGLAPSISSAVGQGAVAARAAYAFLRGDTEFDATAE